MTYTMPGIMAANEAAGHFYFTPDTMSYFNSRVPGQDPVEAEFSDDLYFFVTSERQPASSDGTQYPRRWHVRTFRPSSGDCGSGSGADFTSKATATKAAKLFAQGQFFNGYLAALPAGQFQTYYFNDEWNSVNQDYVEYANRQSDEIYLTQEMRR